MSTTCSAFFYGTLLHPKVLKRVIGHDGSCLKICPAVLLDYTRHRIQDRDYPGVLPYDKSKALFDRELAPEDRSVRGNLVVGLSQSDIELLDVFEAEEYERLKVQVYPLGPLEPINDPSDNVVAISAPALPDRNELLHINTVEADTYVWVAPSDLLVPELWSYDVFIRENAWKWVGPSEDRESYREVDQLRARDLNNIIEQAADNAKEDAIN